jgi:hypothetical protein
MDAESILDRVRTLRSEMRELQELNIQYRERRHHHAPSEIVSHDLWCARMLEIRAELATILDKFAGTKPQKSSI